MKENQLLKKDHTNLLPKNKNLTLIVLFGMLLGLIGLMTQAQTNVSLSVINTFSGTVSIPQAIQSGSQFVVTGQQITLNLWSDALVTYTLSGSRGYVVTGTIQTGIQYQLSLTLPGVSGIYQISLLFEKGSEVMLFDTLIINGQYSTSIVTPPISQLFGGGRGITTTSLMQQQQQQQQQQQLIDAIVPEPDRDMTLVDQYFDNELIGAYFFALRHGITTMKPISQADMYGKLKRKYASKMIVEFARNVLKKNTIVHSSCVFDDIDAIEQDIQQFIILSCQMGIMGQTFDGQPAQSFDPEAYLTRAQFGVMFSRLLYGSLYNGNTQNRYQNHLNALNANGIMNKIDLPQMIEIRGYIMLMMQRYVDSIK